VTADEFHATDVHQLPRSLVRVVRAPAEDPRLPMWEDILATAALLWLYRRINACSWSGTTSRTR
jgi:hypothetical protein